VFWFSLRLYRLLFVVFPSSKLTLTYEFCTHVIEHDKKNLHGLSPRANYTDRATAACRRSDCQLFADRVCHMASVTDVYGRVLGFLDRSRYFSLKQLLSYTHEAEWTPFQTQLLFFLVVPRIEPGHPNL
jgi:hypothetical protein